MHCQNYNKTKYSFIDEYLLFSQPVYHEPYGARSPTSREAATLQIAVGRKGKTKDALSKEEKNKPFQSMRGKEREEANRKLL